ncbi:hypothetical protein BGI41_00260 [Methanobrevibacter sp. 87.7]|nr:archaetidylinositol phosphate synthase [Methanobrevibacter sp. 87.7]OWT33827.1 hypothetical protein BGI41_00260 [Methanobrevibacter sp. 87.7]
MLGSLRPFLTKILNPIAKRLNVNPNILTVISPFFALAAAIFFAKGYLREAAIVILFSGFFDVLDGAVARYHNRTTDFGAFLDSTMDRFSDAIIIIGIAFGKYCTWFIAVLLVHSAITVSYVKARAESKGIQCDVGIAERAVRLIIIMVGAIVGYYYKQLYFTYILIFLMFLSYFTVGQRVYHVWKVTEEEKNRFSKHPVTLSKGNKKEDDSSIDLKKLDEMDKEESKKINSLKNIDDEPLERDIVSDDEFESLFDEEDIKKDNGLRLNYEYDGPKGEDAPFDLDNSNKKIIRRKKRQD